MLLLIVCNDRAKTLGQDTLTLYCGSHCYFAGNVEARVMCFYRRSEIPSSLIPAADKHHWGEVVDMDQDSDDEDDKDKEASTEQAERLNMKQREVFLSRQIELLPATLIRGKCSVTLMSEVRISVTVSPIL